MSREDALRARARSAKRPQKKRKVWEPITVNQMAWRRTVTAFDQSLSATGWVSVVIERGKLHVMRRGTLRPEVPEGVKGHHGSILKALSLAELLRKEDIMPWGGQVVAEQTPVAGYRLESSLLAGYVVAAHYPRTIFVGRQHAQALVLPPDQRSEKRYAKQVVERYVAEDHSLGVGWNEHQRDALMLAIAHLYDLEQS